MDTLVAAGEAARLDSLARYNVLDTPDEASFDRITRIAAQIAGTPIALISLIDAQRQWFKSRHGLLLRETPRDIAFCSHAICGNAPLVVPDATQDPRFQNNPLVTGGFHLRFYAGVPLRMRDGQAIGALCTIDTRPRALSDEQLNALADLARLVADELEFRQLATTDSLTSAYTKRFLEGIVDTEVARSRRYGNRFSVVALDLDLFQQFNDISGRAAGDVWLQAVVVVLKRTLRHVDVVGRVGGDRFVLVLPETPVETAILTAERVRQELAALRVPFGARMLAGSASFGVTQLGDHDEGAKHLLDRAGAALVTAKRSGRNCVVFLSPM